MLHNYEKLVENFELARQKFSSSKCIFLIILYSLYLAPPPLK